MSRKYTAIELCAGAGGQAIGLERAGFAHQALVEIDHFACETLRLNRPHWDIHEKDVRDWDCKPFRGVDLIAAGLPCPPFSIAGKGLGSHDERDLFPRALEIIAELKPKAVMIENVKGFLSEKFSDYRSQIELEFIRLGYHVQWKILNSANFGVCQSRHRVAIVAMQFKYASAFVWPDDQQSTSITVGELLYDFMNANGWMGAKEWRESADGLAPTIVGGSKKHGGPDLGPTGAKKAWMALGVDGKGISYEAPEKDFVGIPKLTVPMVSAIQGFPSDWVFYGKKTNSYRQVGNAFPPPVAMAVALNIRHALQQVDIPQTLVA